MSRNTTRRTCCSARPRRLELERLENRLVLSGVTYPSGDYAVDGVISPYGFDPDTTTLSYSFETAAGLSPFSEAFKENFREIFGWFNHTQVIDVTFAETTGGGDITITPVNYGYGQAGTGSIWMNISYDRAGDTNGFQHGPGSHGYQALIHELGHAIGLKHTFDTPKLLPADDNQTNSAMTYNFSIEPGSFMRYDVVGLQYLYGTGIHNAGNDTYQFLSRIDRLADHGRELSSDGYYGKTSQLLWDTGGSDTLDFAQLAVDAGGYHLDLRPGGLLANKAAYSVANDTFSYGTEIAYYVDIENLVNSNSSDEIILNGVVNQVRGYAAGRSVGQDVIVNATSEDTLDLSAYAVAAVTQMRIGNDLKLTLGSNGSVTIQDYYNGREMGIQFQNGTNAGNRAPAANDQKQVLYEDSPTTIRLAASDPERAVLTYELLSPVAHGGISLGNGTALYTPTANYFGPDSFTYRVSDGQHWSAAAKVSLQTYAVNDAPVALDVHVTGIKDTEIGIPLSASDPDCDPQSLQSSYLRGPAHGTFRSIGGMNWVYVPHAGFTGADSFTYQVWDPSGAESNVATVYIAVTRTGSNQPPTADNQSVTASEDSPKTITLSATDPDGDPLTYTVVTAPAHGTVTLSGNVATYRPAANYNGPDLWTFRAFDGFVYSNSASVDVTVTAVNDAPVLSVPSAKTVNEDSLLSITGISVADVDAASSAVKITISAAQGRLTLTQTTGLTFTLGDGSSDAALTFTGTLADVNAALARVDYLGNVNYSGSDTLSISSDDLGNTGSGGAKTDSKSMAITVAAVNDAPVLTVPGVQVTPTNTPLQISGIGITDADVGSGSLEISLAAARGQLTLARTTGLTFSAGDGTLDAVMTFRGTLSNLNAALSPLRFTPSAGFIGTEAITLTVNDLGNTGSGGAKGDSKSISVQVGNLALVADLVAWWNLNDGSGPRAADIAPAGSDDSGTLRGEAVWNAYGADGAVSLDGNGDGVEVPSTTDVNNRVTGARTVSGWFYVTDKTISSRNQVIFEEGGDQRGLSIYIHNGRLYVGGWNMPTTESGWAGTFLSTDQIQSGRWHHVALVLSGGATITANALRGYLDGVEFGSGAGSQLWAHSDPTGIGQGAALVRFHSGLSSGGHAFAGMLDDLRVYNRVLSAADVAELARQPMVSPTQLTVTVSADSVWENGTPISGTVARSGAVSSALVVTLTSSDPSRLAVSSTVTIAAGQASGTFQLTPQNNALADGTAPIVVAASATGCGGSQDALEVWDDEPSLQTLAAYWALNEGSGTTAADAAPQGINDVASLRGNATWSLMGLGRSVQLRGNTDILAIPDSAELNLMTITQRTVSLWFQVDAAALSAPRQVLFEEGGTDRGLNVYLDGGRLYVGGWNVKTTESGWAGTFLNTAQIQAGRWHHVTLVLSGGATVQADGLRAYLDGALFGSGVASQVWSHGDDTGVGRSAEYTRFHTGIGTMNSHGLTGLIDEVRVYNRVLRDPEIQALAGQSLVSAAGITVSLAASSIPENSGSTLATVTRSGSTAGSLAVTLHSSDTTEATAPATVTIAAGQAAATFTINAVDDAVRDGTQNVTVTASAAGLLAGNGLLKVTDDERILVNGVVTNVTNSWVTVALPQSYVSMVVVATPSYTNAGLPVVPRIRNATGNSFQLRVDRTDGLAAAVPGVTVHYVVAEEGVYTLAKDGVKLEAIKYASTVTDSAGSFLGENRSYAQSYVAPVVLGQVQTCNDANFSVFWSRGAMVSDPASSSVLRVGKHVGEDAVKTRAAETVGYFVVEAGSGSANGLAFTAGVGTKTVQGMDNTPPFQYPLSGLSAASVAVASMAGQLGADGGWAVLYGSDAVTSARLKLAVDEDLKRDSERAHTAESVSYLAFQDTALRLDDAADSRVRNGAAAELTLDAAERLLQRALALWDVADEHLSLRDKSGKLQLQIRDLPSDEIARATVDGLWLDADAAGVGWFVDATPEENEEFLRDMDGSWLAHRRGPAADQVDLLSVLAHELGHLRGLGHEHGDSHQVMSQTLPLGVRRLPPSTPVYQAAVDQVFQRSTLKQFLASRNW